MGVDPDHHGAGIGSLVVEHLARIAGELRVERVFVLTRAPLFFERLGFRTVSVNGLPEKILKDCARCPKKHACDEIAMVRTTWGGGGEWRMGRVEAGRCGLARCSVRAFRD